MNERKRQARLSEAGRAIWLAGLGALAAAKVEGEEYFEHLVELGAESVRRSRGGRSGASEVREPAAAAAEVSPPGAPPFPDAGMLERLRDLTDLHEGASEPFPSRLYLSRIQDLLALSRTELAGLFGISRQAVSKWLDEGVPPARQPKLLTVLDLAELLARQLQPGRLPAVVRRPAPAFGNRSMIEVIAADHHEDLLAQVERSFDWAATA